MYAIRSYYEYVSERAYGVWQVRAVYQHVESGASPLYDTSASRITSYNVCYTKLLRTMPRWCFSPAKAGRRSRRPSVRAMRSARARSRSSATSRTIPARSIKSAYIPMSISRITSYNVCYTKLLRTKAHKTFVGPRPGRNPRLACGHARFLCNNRAHAGGALFSPH